MVSEVLTMIPLPCTTFRDWLAILSLLLLGCAPSGPILCGLERDGAPLVVFEGKLPDASCAVARFPEFVNVIVDVGPAHYAVNVPYDDAEAAGTSQLVWKDTAADCYDVPASATWSRKEGGFDFELAGDCSGVPINARFYSDRF